MTSYEFSKIDRLITLHNKTKRYQLFTESLGADVFTQPMKEERDAYDHLIRAFESIENPDERNNLKYKERQIEKAIGHAYRALYDSLDYLHLIITDKIVLELSKYNEYEILTTDDEYMQIKKKIFDINEKFIESKGMKNSAIDTNEIEDEYCRLIEEYYDCYKKIVLQILPRFWRTQLSTLETDI